MTASRIGSGRILYIGLLVAVLLAPASAFGWSSTDPFDTHSALRQNAVDDDAVAYGAIRDVYTYDEACQILTPIGEPPSDQPYDYHHPDAAQAPYTIPNGSWHNIFQNRLYALEPSVYAQYVQSVPGAPTSLWPQLADTTRFAYLLHLTGDTGVPIGHGPAGELYPGDPTVHNMLEAQVGTWSTYPNVGGTSALSYNYFKTYSGIGSISMDYTGTFQEIWQKHYDAVLYNATWFKGAVEIDTLAAWPFDPARSIVRDAGWVGCIQAEMFTRAFAVDYSLSKKAVIANAGTSYTASAGSSVTFSSAGSQDPDSVSWASNGTYSSNGGGLAAIDWDLTGSGTYNDAHDASFNLSYTQLVGLVGFGPKTVNLRVTDDEGKIGYASASLMVNTPPPTHWTGGANNSWSNASNWQYGILPNLCQPYGQRIYFDSNSTGNLATVDNVSVSGNIHDVEAITLIDPSSSVSIAAGGSLTGIRIGCGGIDMSAAAANRTLTITAPIYLAPKTTSESETWTVGLNRSLYTQQVHGYCAPGYESTAQPLLKRGDGTLVLGNLDSNDNDYLVLDAGGMGWTYLNKASSVSPNVHAVSSIFNMTGNVRYTGTGDSQVYPGGWIIQNGGILDLNGRNQIGTTFVVNNANSLIANYNYGTTSTYSPNSATINTDFSVCTWGNLVLAGAFSGTDWRWLTKTGTGSLTLGSLESTDNSFLALNANAGLTRLNKSSSSSAHALGAISSISSGATVKYVGTGDYQVYSGGWIILNGGTLDLNGKNQVGTPLYVNTAGSQLANHAAGTTSTYTPSGVTLYAGLTVNTAGTLNLNGPITGSGGLTKYGTGLLSLGGTSNNYSGGTTINAGTLQFVNNAPPYLGSIQINSAGALIATGAYNGAYAVRDWLNSGLINASSSGALAIASSTYSTPINMGSYSNLSLGSTGNSTLSGTVTPSGSTYRFGGGGGTLTVSSNLTGSRNTVINGNVTLSGTNNYSLGTTVNNGTLTFSSSSALPSSGTINISSYAGSYGVLAANSVYPSVQSWLNSGKIATSSTGALALCLTSGASINMSSYPNLSLGANGNYIYSGTLTPAGRIYRLGGGNGTLTVASTLTDWRDLYTTGQTKLTGTNTYTGHTYVGLGTLCLTGSGSINYTSGITVQANGQLIQNSSIPLTQPIYLNGGTFGGTGTFDGNLSVNGHLSPGSGGIGTLTIEGNVSMNSGSILDYDFGTTAGSCDLVYLPASGRQLLLDGTININCSGTLQGGAYKIFSHAASVTDNGLLFGNVPDNHAYSYYSQQFLENGVPYYDVYVTAAPEPGPLVLLITGLLSLLCYAWRKRK